MILVSFPVRKRYNGQSASVVDDDQTMLPLQQLLIDISANDNRTTGRYRQVDTGSTDSRGGRLLQTRRLHAACCMLNGDKALINGRHPAVLSKLLHQPLLVTMTSVKTTVTE